MERERWNLLHPQLQRVQLAYYENNYFYFHGNNGLKKVRLNDAVFFDEAEKNRFYKWLDKKSTH